MRAGAVQASSLPSIGYAISAARMGRMSLPVPPSLYIYSQFKHVSGVPAPEGTRGVSINKLKILDVLIEQLGKMKKGTSAPKPLSAGEREGGGELSGPRVDALIAHYESQVRAASVNSVSAAAPYRLAAAPAGAIFDLAV